MMRSPVQRRQKAAGLCPTDGHYRRDGQTSGDSGHDMLRYAVRLYV